MAPIALNDLFETHDEYLAVLHSVSGGLLPDNGNVTLPSGAYDPTTTETIEPHDALHIVQQSS